MHYIEITKEDGTKRPLFLDRIQASPESIQAGYCEFCKESTSAAFKKGYIAYVLGHARLSDRGCALRMDTQERIAQHLGEANALSVLMQILVYSARDERAIAAAEQEAAGKIQ